MLAFAATGEGPFGSGSSAALIYRLVHNPPDLNRAPIETRSLIERCLDKDPGRRPSPRELLAELGDASLAPGWVPESLIRDPGLPMPPPSSVMSAPPAFGSPSLPPSAPYPVETGGIVPSGARARAPGDPHTDTSARMVQPSVPPPWPGNAPAAMPPAGRTPSGRRRSLVIAGIAAALVVVAGGVTAGVVSSGIKHPAAQSELKAQTQATASRSASSATPSQPGSQRLHGKRNGHGTTSASPSASSSATHSAKASPTPHATKRGSGLHPASLTGTWTGSYVCPQGQTGLRLTLKATASGSLTATFSFYPTSTDISVPSGSFALTGSYSARGFQLTPDHWISKPQNYSMVGLDGAASSSDTTLSGSIVSPGCTTFSVSR